MSTPMNAWDPPNDVGAERVVLGSMLLQPNAIELVAERLVAEDFYDGRHMRLFGLLVAEYRAERQTSLPAILGRLTDLGMVSAIDGLALHRLINSVPVVSNVGFYADRVRQLALRRRLLTVAIRTALMATQDRERSAEACVQAARGELDRLEAAAVGDSGGPVPIGEFLQGETGFDWLIPGLVERGDRLVVTAPESFGKSTLVRQLAVCAAAGVHPFDWSQTEPLPVLVVDCENSAPLNRRRFHTLVAAAGRAVAWGRDNLWIECRPDGLDLARGEDAAWLARQVRKVQPQLLALGPIYKLHNDNPNEEQAAKAIASVIDGIRGRFGCAVVMEAHSPHGDGKGPRPVRPIGASLWLRWPETGLGLRPVTGADPRRRVAQLVCWKARDGRTWPAGLRSGPDLPWVAMSAEELEFETDQGGDRR